MRSAQALRPIKVSYTVSLQALHRWLTGFTTKSAGCSFRCALSAAGRPYDGAQIYFCWQIYILLYFGNVWKVLNARALFLVRGHNVADACDREMAVATACG